MTDHKKKHYKMTLNFSIQSIFLMLSGKQRPADGGRPIKEFKHGWNWSKDGTLAEIHQVVDRVKNVYQKYVKTADGTVVKNVKGSLKDQSLHGKQPPTV